MIGTTYKAQEKKRHEPWRSNERHYCEACNKWMGSDRQSILVHENGRKHKENVEKLLTGQRQQRVAQDAAAQNVQKMLAKINADAISSHVQDVNKYGVSALNSFSLTTTAIAGQSAAVVKSEVVSPTSSKTNNKNKDDEKSAWESRKKKRENEKKKNNSDDDSDNEDTIYEAREIKRVKQELAPDEGNYKIEDNIYLEGVTFIKLLEEEMPMEVWTGSLMASLEEKRLLEKQHLWQPGIILKVRRSLKDQDSGGKVLDIAYTKSGDEKEILEKSVLPNRIRIILGSDSAAIPDTLEEARIAAVGGQVITKEEDVKLEVDETTGLSSWGTIEIRKTTVRQEIKEERERARAKRREEVVRQEQEQKRAEGRRMEEARVENADDSALGSYDVWNAGKAGYKGVNINTEDKMTAADAQGISLSGGKKVGFKKKNKFKKGKKQNRRTTSADDL